MTIAAKLLVQRLWKEGLQWDEEVSDALSSEWKNLAGHMFDASTATQPRKIVQDTEIPTTLHIYVDSSMSAYAAAAYINNSLLFAKAKVAPTKMRTIPELELMAMHLGSIMGQFL